MIKITLLDRQGGLFVHIIFYLLSVNPIVFYGIRPGNQVASGGKMLHANKTIQHMIRNGNTSRTRCPIFASPMAETTKRRKPTGGVAIPIIRFSTMTNPRWTGSSPIWWPTAVSAGKKMSIAGIGSMVSFRQACVA